jgi:hypothetical protein
MARERQATKTTLKRSSATAPADRSRPARSPGRYTPPQPKSKKHSPLWIPVAMFTLLAAGIVVIVANYLELLPGGEAQNSDLILGLVLIVGAFVMSTQYR